MNNDRSYTFTSTFDGALHSMCTADTPKMVAFVNFTDEPIYIRRNQRLWFIADSEDDAFVATDRTKATAAQTATVLGDDNVADRINAFMSQDLHLTDDLIHGCSPSSTLQSPVALALAGGYTIQSPKSNYVILRHMDTSMGTPISGHIACKYQEVWISGFLHVSKRGGGDSLAHHNLRGR